MIELLGAGAAALILAYMLRRKQQIKDQKQQQGGQRGQGDTEGSGGGESQAQMGSSGGESNDSSTQDGGQAQEGSQKEEFEKAEYSVFDSNADQVANCYTPEEAKEALKEKAELRGTIFNNQTGQEVEPPLNLIDKILRWLRGLGKKPIRKPVFQIDEEKPLLGPMSEEQIDALLTMAGKNHDTRSLECDPVLLRRCLEQINQLDLPVFNVAKKRYEDTYQTIEVMKRRQMIRHKEVLVPEEKTTLTSKTSLVPSVIPAEDIDVRPIRAVSELKKLHPRVNLALPTWLFGRRLTDHELHVVDFLAEERSEERTTQMVKRRRIVDEPYVEEYKDTMEIAKEPKGQLLYILLDGSYSMAGVNAHMAAATAMAVIGRHLNDTSRYLYRLFTDFPKDKWEGLDKSGKKSLVWRITNCFSTNGGTDILVAIKQAAEDIRALANPDDQPEILLVTDGEDNVTAEDLYSVLGEDIILHTVAINGRGNYSLQQHSSTYVRLTSTRLDPVEISMR